MRLRYNSVTLDQVVGGTLATGTVPLLRTMRTLVRNANGGIITVLAADTTVVLLSAANVVSGDIIHVTGMARLVKGGVAGAIHLHVVQVAGTASILWGFYGSELGIEIPSLGAGANIHLPVSGYAEVDSSGTCQLALVATSAGSNASVAIGEGQFSAMVLIGA
jgi:hypothetical protein